MAEEEMNRPVWFREWVAVPGADVRITRETKQACRLALGSYLGYLKVSGKRVTPLRMRRELM